MRAFLNPEIERVFDAFPVGAHAGLMALRSLIFDVAKQSEQIDDVEESLRWGQPAYLTKTGTTIRLGTPKTGGFAIFTHCQTTVMSDFQKLFGEDFKFDGNRAVIFQDQSEINVGKLSLLIHNALTYHLK